MATDETILIDKAKEGDRRSLEELLQRHYELVFSIARRITGNEHDAAEACQEALIKIARSITKFDGRSKLSTWIHRIATNAALDELRKRKRRPIPQDESEVGGFAAALAQESIATSSNGGFDERLAQRQTLTDALAEIRPEFAEAVILRDVHGLDYAEIAAALDISGGTVRSRIARGRRKLAEILTSGNSPRLANVERGSN